MKNEKDIRPKFKKNLNNIA